MMTPAKMKKGIARRVNLATLVYMISVTASKPYRPLEDTSTSNEEIPNASAIGTRKKISTKNAPNKNNAIIVHPPHLV